MSASTEQVKAALADVKEPLSGRGLVELGCVRDVEVDGGRVGFRVVLGVPGHPLVEEVRGHAQTVVKALPGVTEVEVSVETEVPNGRPSDGGKGRLEGVKNVIAVASGKGGVGKSTVSVNLAVALSRLGAKTGLLDADIYGPSLPTMLGLSGQIPPLDEERRKLIPLEAHGLRTISMGVLIKEDDAVVWRGPMLGKALQQLLEDVDWGDLDYLVVDLPPGTGDVQLSLAQLTGVNGAVVVTTPQDVAHKDVVRAVQMLKTLNTPVIGVVENMSYFVCPDNGETYYIFGKGRTEEVARELDLPVLQEIPLDMIVAPSADQGKPVAAVDPGGDQARRYEELAHMVAARIAVEAASRAKQARQKAFFNVAG